MLEQYNRGVFEFMIVTDQSVEYAESGDASDDEVAAVVDEDEDADSSEEEDEDEDDSEEEDEDSEEEEQEEKKKVKKSNVLESGEKRKGKQQPRKGARSGQNFGVARGFDFKNVKTVVNFDFPLSVKSYVHRVGRTARGGQSGEALSLVNRNEVYLLEEVRAQQQANVQRHAEADSASSSTSTKGTKKDALDVESVVNASVVRPLEINRSDINNFRYRVEGVLQGVTGVRVKELRFQEIRQEMINSQKLHAHWEDNPKELELLKHSRGIKPVLVRPHLKHIPKYLQPSSGELIQGGALGSRKRVRSRRRNFLSSTKSKARSDPLKSFTYGASSRKGALTNSRVSFEGKKRGRGGSKRRKR